MTTVATVSALARCALTEARDTLCFAATGRGNDDGGTISQVTVLSPVMAWILGVQVEHVHEDGLCPEWPKLFGNAVRPALDSPQAGTWICEHLQPTMLLDPGSFASLLLPNR